MSKDYKELTAKAVQHLASLEAVAWLRVGTAICGQAAGATDLLQAIPTLAEKRNLPFVFSPWLRSLRFFQLMQHRHFCIEFCHHQEFEYQV